MVIDLHIKSLYFQKLSVENQIKKFHSKLYTVYQSFVDTKAFNLHTANFTSVLNKITDM